MKKIFSFIVAVLGIVAMCSCEKENYTGNYYPITGTWVSEKQPVDTLVFNMDGKGYVKDDTNKLEFTYNPLTQVITITDDESFITSLSYWMLESHQGSGNYDRIKVTKNNNIIYYNKIN